MQLDMPERFSPGRGDNESQYSNYEENPLERITNR